MRHKCRYGFEGQRTITAVTEICRIAAFKKPQKSRLYLQGTSPAWWMRDSASCVDEVKVILLGWWGRSEGNSKDHLYHLTQPSSLTNLKPPYLTSVYPSEIYQGNRRLSIINRNYRTTALRPPRLLLYWKLWFYYGSFNTLSPKMNKPHDWPLTTIPHFSKIMPRIDEEAVHCPPKDPWVTRIQLPSNL